jgi:hypothetical protein
MTYENRHCKTLSERKDFCIDRNTYRKKQSDALLSTAKPVNCIEVKCKNCGNSFYARKADIKRGWGKFCSKSCKAEHR